MYRRLVQYDHPIQLLTKYGLPPTTRTCQTCSVIRPTAPNAKRMGGREMHTLRSKRVFIILTRSPSTKNGWPITAMNNNQTVYCRRSFQQMDGVMNGEMVLTGPVRSPWYPGIFICFMATRQCCLTVM